MSLVKDAPILDLLRNRVVVSYGSVDAARTIETRRLWKHRQKCYQKAMEYIRLAEAIPGTEPDEPTIMDYSEENVCVRD
jgi:hypothetical protein